MKFIFPQNYHFKNKILGVIDYTTAIVNIVWCGIVLFLIHFVFSSLTIKVILFILLCFPLFLFSFSGFHGENIISVFFYIIKFMIRQKLYFYGKNNKKMERNFLLDWCKILLFP